MKKVLVWLITTVLLTSLILVVWQNRYNIYDYWRLRNYTPQSTISGLADETTMTSKARKLFYVYHPIIENSSAFNLNCSVTEQAIVLGCTVINQGIYMYNVQDQDLNGVEQVTAAHEMLHVAYSRLNSSQQKYIDSLIMAEYNKLSPTNENLRNEYNNYVKTEGLNAVPNEMHSILGTEISDLSPALENYYKNYFTNRQIVATYASKYQNAFTQRQQQVKQDDLQLNSLQQQINAYEADIKNQDSQLVTQSSLMNQQKANNEIGLYNNEVGSYNIAVVKYNKLVKDTQYLIDQYNNLLNERNKIAVSENKLIQEISSKPSTIGAN